MKWCFGLFVGQEWQMLGGGQRGLQSVDIIAERRRGGVGVVDVAF